MIRNREFAVAAVPVEFKEFVRLFLQDSLEESSEMSEFVARAVRLLDRDKKPAVKAYVDEILDSRLDETALDEMWKSCRPNYWIAEGKMREFLSEVQNQLS